MWITKPYKQYKQRSETQRETEAFGLGELEASPFGSRMPKETPAKNQLITHAFLFLCFFALGLFDLTHLLAGVYYGG